MNSKIRCFIFVLCFLTFLTCSPVALTEGGRKDRPKEGSPEEEILQKKPFEEEIFGEELFEEVIPEEEILEDDPSLEEELEAELEDIQEETEVSDDEDLTDEETQEETSETVLDEEDAALLLLSDSLEEELLANPAEPAYVLTIPQNIDVPFNTTSTQLGTVSIESSSGFQEGQDLSVTITYDSFSTGTSSSQIPYLLSVDLTDSASGTVSLGNVASGQQLTFKGTQDGTLLASDLNGSTSNGENPYTNFVINFEAESESWLTADPGTYSSEIVFVSSITE